MKRLGLLFTFLMIIVFSCKTTQQASLKEFGSPNVEHSLINDNTFQITQFSKDKTYGYEQLNPIMVGGVKNMEGPLNQRRFLNALAGPNGEEIGYYRVGSCCHFKTKNSTFGGTGLLDIYNVFYEGLQEPIELYLNMYDSDTLRVPVGFTLKNL
ncbi:MAG: 2-dehydro-3-deoxyphosphooctonate aldolase [Bacteroidetes bacterium]|nr:2-dehydro-3-deoxyphosphooctonate aldolase [Bacteroidota bacterium]